MKMGEHQHQVFLFFFSRSIRARNSAKLSRCRVEPTTHLYMLLHGLWHQLQLFFRLEIQKQDGRKEHNTQNHLQIYRLKLIYTNKKNATNEN